MKKCCTIVDANYIRSNPYGRKLAVTICPRCHYKIARSKYIQGNGDENYLGKSDYTSNFRLGTNVFNC